MVKRKIGILVFTDKIKFRGTRKNLYIKIFNTKKYQLLSAEEKIRVIKEYANPELYQENYNITVNYLVPNYDFKKAVKIYE